MRPQHHTINYLELPSTDIQRTKQFYTKLFNWEFTDWGADYVSFSGAGIDGGFNAVGEVTPEKPGVLVVLYSQDLERTHQQILDEGGEIIVPIFEFPGGRRFHFKDLCGNQLAVWSE